MRQRNSLVSFDFSPVYTTGSGAKREVNLLILNKGVYLSMPGVQMDSWEGMRAVGRCTVT